MTTLIVAEINVNKLSEFILPWVCLWGLSRLHRDLGDFFCHAYHRSNVQGTKMVRCFQRRRAVGNGLCVCEPVSIIFN